ncbi:hypothetical protein H2248_002794 [Termitomyces sp. 'cryptogamus']|nr:hypothetical protein H2248_002794 [Termitomyces sp. 'cryptogamus']
MEEELPHRGEKEILSTEKLGKSKEPLQAKAVAKHHHNDQILTSRSDVIASKSVCFASCNHFSTGLFVVLSFRLSAASVADYQASKSGSSSDAVSNGSDTEEKVERLRIL